MNTARTNIILIALAASAFILGIILYPKLPSEIASHWNAAGDVNGYMGKFWGVFLFPVIILAVYGAYLVIPKIDPLKKNIESFRAYYNGFWILLSAFLLYVFVLTLIWNLGHFFNFSTALAPALAVLFYFLGVLLKHSKRNWFVGIRTPWTLSDDIVWEKTHRIGGRLFQYSAVAVLVGALFPRLFSWFLFIPIVVSALYTVVYSYVAYRALGRTQGHEDASH